MRVMAVTDDWERNWVNRELATRGEGRRTTAARWGWVAVRLGGSGLWTLYASYFGAA